MNDRIRVFTFGDFAVMAGVIFIAVYLFLFPRSSFIPAKVRIDFSGKPYGEWELPHTRDTLDIGNKMKIEISAQGVRVLESTCPRGICMHQGLISKPHEEIICVPNKIVIRFIESTDSPDAYVQ